MGCPDLSLTVAHFDHGIRMDFLMQFLRLACTRYGLPFVTDARRVGCLQRPRPALRVMILRRTLQGQVPQQLLRRITKGDRGNSGYQLVTWHWPPRANGAQRSAGY